MLREIKFTTTTSRLNKGSKIVVIAKPKRV